MRDYLRVIHSVDRNIGRVLDYLEKAGLLENTMIVYTSDQGFYMGEHGWFDKRFMYEESFRTPLLVRLVFMETWMRSSKISIMRRPFWNWLVWKFLKTCTENRSCRS